MHLEGDCLQVINALNDKNGDRLFSFGVVISVCPELFSSFEAFICSFIRRVGNSLAHSLAHISLYDTLVLDGVFPLANLAHLIQYPFSLKKKILIYNCYKVKHNGC